MGEDDKRVDQRKWGAEEAEDHGHLWDGRMREDATGHSLHYRFQVEVRLYT